jgi:hypothetical protein
MSGAKEQDSPNIYLLYKISPIIKNDDKIIKSDDIFIKFDDQISGYVLLTKPSAYFNFDMIVS